MKIYLNHFKSPNIHWEFVPIGFEHIKLSTNNNICLYCSLGKHRFEINFIYVKNKRNGN